MTTDPAWDPCAATSVVAESVCSNYHVAANGGHGTAQTASTTRQLTRQRTTFIGACLPGSREHFGAAKRSWSLARAVGNGTLWINAADPLSSRRLQRLVAAQDTGSGSTGATRADHSWGWGEAAEAQAVRRAYARRIAAHTT